MRISERRLICAIKNVSRIRLARLSKNLLSFLIFNLVIPISLFFIVLAARFPLSIPFKRCIQLLRRGRRLIRKGGDVTGIIYRYAGACIRPATSTRLGLTPHPPLAKTSADP
jgi:hypothetical protein